MSNWLLNLFRKTPTMKIITSPGWNFEVKIDGEDILVENCTATWFGGGNDKWDNGETASGVMNDGRNPDLSGCALPVAWYSKSTEGSPLIPIKHSAIKKPSIPWHTPVIVTHGAKTITTSLIDNGPAKSAKDAIDLTQADFKRLGGTLKQGVITVSFTIPGGAKYILP